MTRRASQPASKAVQAAFERLMTAYPRRGDNPRAPALAVFARLVAEGEDAETLIAAASRFAQVMRDEAREARMIPHTRTWLSQRRFEDYADAPASAPAGPSPDHPLAFLAAEIGDAAWRSWIAPLTVETGSDGASLIIRARTETARRRVVEAYAARIRKAFGPDVAFVIGAQP